MAIQKTKPQTPEHGTMAQTTTTTTDSRAEYRRIRARSHAKDHTTFDATVKGMLAPDAGPEQWVAAAKLARFTCRRCAGTGQFITGSLNGKPTGPGGMCFRCEGKAERNDADERRNYGHDLHYMGGC